MPVSSTTGYANLPARIILIDQQQIVTLPYQGDDSIVRVSETGMDAVWDGEAYVGLPASRIRALSSGGASNLHIDYDPETGRASGYVRDGRAHTIQYPSATAMVDIGPDGTVNFTLDAQGRITDVAVV